MNTITVSYTLVWQLKDSPEYQFTKNGMCFNVKRGTRLKQVYNSGSIGFNIKGKFQSLNKLRQQLTKIKKHEYHF